MRWSIINFCFLWGAIGGVFAQDNNPENLPFSFEHLVRYDHLIQPLLYKKQVSYGIGVKDSTSGKNHQKMIKKEVVTKDAVSEKKEATNPKFKQVWESKQNLPSYRHMYIKK